MQTNTADLAKTISFRLLQIKRCDAMNFVFSLNSVGVLISFHSQQRFNKSVEKVFDFFFFITICIKIMESGLSAADIEEMTIEVVEMSMQQRRQLNEDDETFEEVEFADDDDYEPGTKKSVSSSTCVRQTKSKTIAKQADEQQKRKNKVLKKDIELPIKIDLIGLVKNERSLYNLKDPLYLSRTHKDKVWLSICDAMKKKHPGMEVEKCKRMWNAVRESTR